MSRSAVFEKLQSMGAMPTPSSVALEIMRLCRADTSSLSDIAAVVETDPSLSAKLLQYVNSAMISPGTAITSIPKATVKLGMQTVMNLALGFSLLAQNKSGICLSFDYNTFWSRSLAKAISARLVCRLSRRFDPDEAFICALLSHIGSLALASLFPEEYALILKESLSQSALLEKEKNQFGITNKELSGDLFLAWGLPELFSHGVTYSGSAPPSDLSNKDLEELCSLLVFADTITEICMLEIPIDEKITSAVTQAGHFNIEQAEFSNLFDSIVENWQKWGHTFQIPTPNCPLFKDLNTTEHPPQQVEKQIDSPITVLAVDDDPMTLMTLEHLLKSKGKKVYTAENGESALKLALEKQPDMVITDWKMPKVSGIELCKVLRNTSITKHIYIIMLTGRESEEELIEALDAGADEFIIKPFTPRVLEARLNSGERIIRFQQMVNRDREVIQKYAARLAAANSKLQAMAMTDALTGLPNRRSAMEHLKKIVAETRRHNEPLSCIMIDIDHFKQINDTHGHDTGDQILIEIAKVFRKTLRSYDSVSRMGGEEFLVICGRSTLQESQQLAERLRQAVETMRINIAGATIQTTISLGVAAWKETTNNGDEMIREADNALYQAKERGRNKVVASKD